MMSPLNSLTTRIVAAVALILTLASALIGSALYRNIRRSVHDELKSQLTLRLAWMSAAAELDEEGRLEFDSKLPHAATPQNWRIATIDGRLLWSAPDSVKKWDDDPAFVQQTTTIEIGESPGKELHASELQVASEAIADKFAIYSTPVKGGRLALILSAREPVAASERELQRVALALWTIGPASIVLLVAILALFIRWQHAPLNAMSIQASTIGPENTDMRIGDVGSGVELVRLREALNAMVSRLADGMKRERQFSSMAAHELRTPLTQMRFNVEIALNKDRVAADYKEALSQSLTDIDRLQNLVVNLLFLTRDYRGPEMRRDVALFNAVEQAAKSCVSDAAIPSDLRPIVVLGNAELLQSAIRNVLENARRYAPGAPADITVSVDEKIIELRITDSGPGIRAEDRERIFEPLTRLDEARTIGGSADGFGLGLTVARNAVRACGGELVCKPRLDATNGAMFVFTFLRAIQAPSNT